MVGVAPAANAPADFDPLDMRHALSGSEDADTAHSVPQEMAKALANPTSKAGEASAPMTMRMPAQSELQNESPTHIDPPIVPDRDATVAVDAGSVPILEGSPPAPSALARAAQTSSDPKPLERKPLVTTVAMMGPVTKIPLPSSRGSNLPVRASRMPTHAGVSPSNTPPREAERAPDPVPPPAPVPKITEPPPPPAQFDGTLESASGERREEPTMMVLPEEIIEEPSMLTVAAPSQPSDGGTMMLAPVKHAASMVATPEPPSIPPAEPEMPKTQPPRIKSNLKTSIGMPPVFQGPPPVPSPAGASPHGPMISPTPIVSIAPAPPPPQQISITPAIPPAGAPAPRLSSLPVRPTVQLHQATQSMLPPVPKPIAQTPVMPAAMRASYAQLPPHQWPADQNISIPPAMPQPSIGPMSDPSRPLTYSVFDPAELANVPVRSPSVPSRASFSDQKPGMSAGIKVGLAALAICLVAGTAGAIVLGTSDDSPSARPATSASVTSASSTVPIPIPTPTDMPSAVPPPDPPPTSDPTTTPTAATAPTSTGKKKPKNPPPGGVPPNPFASGIPGKRK